jgi:hypothetical protein
LLPLVSAFGCLPFKFSTLQYNFTDPESRIMLGADGFVQAYNTQIAVEPNYQCPSGHPKPANEGHLKTGQRE